MKWWSVCVAVLLLLVCKDPNSFQPFDPTKPDPPAPPVLTYPTKGWTSDDYAYPQNVSFAWQAVPGAQFYELQIQTDSLFPGTHPGLRVYQTSWITPCRRSASTTGGFGRPAETGTTTLTGQSRCGSPSRIQPNRPAAKVCWSKARSARDKGLNK